MAIRLAAPLALIFAIALCLPGYSVRVNNIDFHIKPNNLSALGKACYADDLATVRKLLNAANVNQPCADLKFCPVHVAVTSGKTSVLRYLLDHGANARTPVAAADFRGLTPLHLAAVVRNTEIVKLLIARGAAVNAEEEIEYTSDASEPPAKFTPYDIALIDHNDAVAAILRAHGAVPRQALSRYIQSIKTGKSKSRD